MQCTRTAIATYGRLCTREGALVVPLLGASLLLSGCDSRCLGLDETPFYGFDARFSHPVVLEKDILLELKTYATPLGSEGFRVPIVFCISDENLNVDCTESGDVFLEEHAIVGLRFGSNRLAPPHIDLEIEARPMLEEGPVDLVAAGEASFQYERSTYETTCTDETFQIERATATIKLHP
jgi:hypothetical protein